MWHLNVIALNVILIKLKMQMPTLKKKKKNQVEDKAQIGKKQITLFISFLS